MSDEQRPFRIPPGPKTLIGIEPTRAIAEQALVRSTLAQKELQETDDKVSSIADAMEDLGKQTWKAVRRIEGVQKEHGGRLENIEGAYLREIVPTFQAIKARLDDFDARLGHPAVKLDPARISHVEQRTSAELIEMERNLPKATGVFGAIAALELHDARVIQMSAVAAGKAAGQEAAKVATKAQTRKITAIVTTFGSVLTVANATSNDWGPPLVKLLKFLFHSMVGG